MICQCCGVEAESKHVAFYQNIGALVVRFPKSIEGRLCKSCVHKHFWSMTGTTFFLGWWGAISFLVTPFYLLNNIGRYILCLGMSPVAPGATQPQLSDAVVEKLTPHVGELCDRLNAGEDFAIVATRVAERAGVTPGQVALFTQALVEARWQGQ